MGNTEVIYLRYANAKELVPILNGISKGIAEPEAKAVKGAPPDRITAHIEADESSNALVITAPPDVLRSLKAVVKKLDIRRAQILVEAVIAEVGEETASELGIQWAGASEGDDLSGAGVVNFSSSGSGIIDIAAAIDNETPLPIDGLTLGIGNGDPLTIGMVLRALAGDANNNILATPNLLTMDNEEAEIIVGQEVPYLTGSYTSIAGAGATPQSPFQTYQRKDVGLVLRVKPQINEGDAVKLDVTHETSSVSSVTTGFADLVTNKRSIKTSVMVDDGQMIVLGGLIDEQLREGVQKVPGLGDIPLLGALFRYNKTQLVKTNHMVFLQPTILRTADQNYSVASEKYSLIRAHQLRSREKGIALMPDEVVPVLPELGQPLTRRPSPEVQADKKEDEEKQPDKNPEQTETRNYWDTVDGE